MKRTTFMLASIIARIVPSESHAGPIEQMIFVFCVCVLCVVCSIVISARMNLLESV